MQIKYCLPLVCERAQEVTDAIAQHEREYAFFEVWLDYLDEANGDFIRQLSEQYPDRILFLFRVSILIHRTWPSISGAIYFMKLPTLPLT